VAFKRASRYPPPTADRVREVFDYDPDVGVFQWRKRPHPAACRVRPGGRAGCVNPNGYRVIELDGVSRRGHHLAWLYIYGVWPSIDLDHRNGRRDDNRIANLREDPDTQNAQNQHSPQRGNKAGYLGVAPNGNRWQAKIVVDHQKYYLGAFATPEEASTAYLAAKNALHPFWDRVE